ncbi:MAG: hypothetical protein M3552_01305 [Planctomycetota bacterium]|nr:hypothetical protein [Planctomycetaceae bacterium]MDQ3329282.1 hypothetical protein [Planctomycetota bacterium]
MPESDRFIGRLRRRLLLGDLLHVSAGWLAGFLIVFGSAVLAAKLFGPQFWPGVLWLGLLTIPMFAALAWRTSRRAPSDRETIALLDKRLGAGGLFMTLAERPDALWQQRLPGKEAWSAVLPRFRPTRFLKAIAVPALFAIGAGFIPAREVPPPGPRVTVGSSAAQELAEAFELLEKADALDEETKESLKQELDQLAQDAEEKPLTHEKWETVDALRERLQSGLDVAELTVSKGRNAAASLAAGLTGGEALSLERTEQLSQDLAEALETLRKNGALKSSTSEEFSRLPSELQQLLKSGQFKLPSDPAERQQALSNLQKLLESEAKRLAEARSKCQNCLAGQCRDGQCFGKGPGQNSPIARSEIPGKGGITRGRGDAEMSYGDESDEQAAKFKETVLPPGFLDRPSDSPVGVSASAPTVEPEAPSSRNAARETGSATGKATWDRPLRPRHREVVRGYFGDE